jgi:hypothetical protein
MLGVNIDKAKPIRLMLPFIKPLQRIKAELVRLV